MLGFPHPACACRATDGIWAIQASSLGMKGTEKRDVNWGSGRFGVGQEQVLGEADFTSWPCPAGQCCPSMQPQDQSHQGRARALQLLYSHCHFSLQQLCFYFSPDRNPPDLAPCQEEPNTALDFLLFLFYCRWLGRWNFLCPPSPDQRVLQERAAWQILPKTIPALPAHFALLEVWALSPTVSLQYICCNFPFKHPTGEKKNNPGGAVVLLGQAELRQRRLISQKSNSDFSAAPRWGPRQSWWQEHTHLLSTHGLWLSPLGWH